MPFSFVRIAFSLIFCSLSLIQPNQSSTPLAVTLLECKSILLTALLDQTLKHHLTSCKREREDRTFLILTCPAPTSLLTCHTSHIKFCHFPGQPMLRHGYMLLLVLLSDLEYPFLSVFWPSSNFLLRVTLLQPSGLLVSVWFSPHLYLPCS